MNFVSLPFFLIVTAAILLYHIVPLPCRWYVLLAASVSFYFAAAGMRGFLAVLLTAALAYASALRIAADASGEKKKKKLLLTAALTVLIGLLVLFKIERYVGGDARWLVVPLGVSYYTFSIIGYLVDVYSKKQAPERNFLKLLLYTLYFPKIVQGPISKFRVIGPRLVKGHAFDYRRFCYGLQRVLWGYFKKLIVVERAVLLTGTVFDGDLSDCSAGGPVLLIVAVIATLSHYCDFSGYMDIVIGVSQMMGIELDENFRQPFFSKSAAEFWRRWHMTLGAWFKDYVYLALVIHPGVLSIGKWTRERFGKNAGRTVLTVIPLAVVWLLTGLWHGTSFSYVLWGCYWGTIIILSNLLARFFQQSTALLHISTQAKGWQLFQMIRTFFLFMGGLLLSTLVGWRQMGLFLWLVIKDIKSTSLHALFDNGFDHINFVILCAAFVLLWFVDLRAAHGSMRDDIARLNGLTRWFLYAMLILVVVFFGVYGTAYPTHSFAYEHF